MTYNNNSVGYNPAEIPDHFGLYKPQSQTPPKSSPVKVLAVVMCLALLIIGSIGAAGVFSGTTIGWVALGLAGALSLLSIALFKSDNASVVTILSGIALVIIGALGGTGILSPIQVGWGLVGTMITHLVIRSTCAAWISQQRQRALQEF